MHLFKEFKFLLGKEEDDGGGRRRGGMNNSADTKSFKQTGEYYISFLYLNARRIINRIVSLLFILKSIDKVFFQLRLVSQWSGCSCVMCM